MVAQDEAVLAPKRRLGTDRKRSDEDPIGCKRSRKVRSTGIVFDMPDLDAT